MKNRFYFFLLLLISLTVLYSCGQQREKRASLKIKNTTTALYETDPVAQNKKEDAADDPAFWLNRNNPSGSLIVGTDKKAGLAVYDLKGKQLSFYPDGRMNNVDIRYDFVLGEDTLDLVCSSNRSNQSISIYAIEPDGTLKNLAVRVIASEVVDEVYGFTLYKSPLSRKTFAFINSKAGEIEQWELFATENLLIDARKVRSFKLKTQVEGMVADDENQVIFIGEEAKGIWKFGAEPTDHTQGELLAKSTSGDNANIVYDIEGLAIYFLPDNKGYLLASSQGNYSYAVYNRKEPHEYLGSFRIVDGVVDGVEDTDGIDIYSFPLNEDFKHGIFIAQDGYNFDGKKALPQNFKYVPWEHIAKLFSPSLKMNH